MREATRFGKSYSSFSGQDIRVIANGHHIGNITSISFNIQREKQGNYVIGQVDPISFGRGKRQISGIIKGLVLDTDLLSHRAFDGEVALLDKNELFSAPTKSTETRTRTVTRPKYPNLGPPPVKLSEFDYFMQLFTPTLPNFGQLPDIETALEICVESVIESLLTGAAAAIVTGGLGSVALGALFIDAVVSCAEGILDEAIVEGGIQDFALQIAASIYAFYEQDMYSNYETNFNQLETTYNNRQSEVIVEEITEEIETDLGIQDYSFTVNRKYNVSELGENYSVAKVEYLDQILPFDIVIIAVNEYGQKAQMRIYGVEALGESKSMSIDDITLNYEVPFIARAILPWRSFELKGVGNAQSNQRSNPGGALQATTGVPVTSVETTGPVIFTEYDSTGGHDGDQARPIPEPR